MATLKVVGGGNDAHQEFSSVEAAKTALKMLADRHNCGLSFEGILGTHGYISKGASCVGSWSITV